MQYMLWKSLGAHSSLSPQPRWPVVGSADTKNSSNGQPRLIFGKEEKVLREYHASSIAYGASDARLVYES